MPKTVRTEASLFNLFSRGRQRSGRKRRVAGKRRIDRRRVLLENLEPRHLLAAVTVTSLADTVDSSDGVMTLREALITTNAAPDADTINFDSGLSGSVLMTMGEFEITNPVTINGNGASHTILDAQSNSRVFKIGNYSNRDFDVTLDGLTITGGRVEGVEFPSEYGGGIFNRARLELSNSMVTDNHAASDYDRGGGIYSEGLLNVVDTTISNNSADYGGGIESVDGLLDIRNSEISGNQAGSGAGIHVRGNGSVTGSTISNNSSTGFGGGIAVVGLGGFDISDSTIFGNTAYGGAGIENHTATVRISNSTVLDNHALQQGGGILTFSQGHDFTAKTTLLNSTVTGNLAFEGGGLSNFGSSAANGFSSVEIINSIVAGNGSDDLHSNHVRATAHVTSSFVPNVVGTLDTDVNNLDPATDWKTVLHSTEADPILSYQGGPTQVVALRPGSPAINAGDNSLADGLGTDQRGMARINDSVVDMGAVEYYASFLVDTDENTHDGDYSEGDLSLREAIALANAQPGFNTIEFDTDYFTAATPRTINFDAAENELLITSSVDIMGPGADVLAIDANQLSRVFSIGSRDNRDFDVTLDGLTITGGRIEASAYGGVQGGGILNWSRLELSKIIITDNHAVADSKYGEFSQGGGIKTLGDLSLIDTTISNNSATHSGGIYGTSSSLNILNSIITGNQAANAGGVFTKGIGIIVGSTISDNLAEGFGGGILMTAFSKLTISSSTIVGNTASHGAGVLNSGGTVQILNSTLFDNHAVQQGGGIYSYASGSNLVAETHLLNTTVTGNSAPKGGGVFNSSRVSIFSSNVEIVNSIVAGNGSEDLHAQAGVTTHVTSSFVPNVVGTLDTDVNNLDPATDWITVLHNDETDPILANNGGPTQTVALIPGGAATNSGNNALAVDENGSPLIYDQRGTGFDRIAGTVDMGAFEIQNTVPVAVPGGPYFVDEGSTVTLDASGSYDAEQSTESLTYTWDFDGDGVFGETGAAASRGDEVGITPTFDAADLDGDSLYSPSLIVTDNGGLSTLPTIFNINVANVDPTLVVDTDASTIDRRSANKTVVLTGQVSDDGIADTHTVVVDWGDGSDPETISDGQASPALLAEHTYETGGIFTVTVTATDDDGAAVTTQTTAVIEGVGLVDGTLYVIGSEGDDKVKLDHKDKKNELKVDATFDRDGGEDHFKQTFVASEVKKVVSFLGDGDDKFDGKKLLVDLLVFAGDGDDDLKGGDGNDALFGGLGKDKIKGRDGNDILVGGDGKDDLKGEKDDDLLIGGILSDLDFNDVSAVDSAFAALSQWSPSQDLNATIALLGDVDDDEDEDKLDGGKGNNHLIGGLGDRLKD